MARRLSYFIAIIGLAFASQTAFADVKVKSKQTMSGQSYENTTYIKGKRQRSEMMNGMMINITQCDLRRGVQINTTTQTYMVNPFVSVADTATRAAGRPTTTGSVEKGGLVTTTVTTKDTGERKQMFGYTARHLIITMETESSPDSCSKTNSKIVTDGWYIDFEPQFDCGDVSSYSASQNYKQSGCQDKYSVKNIGSGKRGYPVLEKMTMFDGSGKETMSMTNEVVELSKATLDPALFEVPNGYREVSDATQMYSTSASTSSITGRGTSIDQVSSLPGLSSKRPEVSSSSIDNQGETQTLGPKQAGVVRIGLAEVKTGSVGDGVPAADLAAAVQSSLQEYLKVPNLEVVVLSGKLPSAIEADAKDKECDLILTVTASHKKGGGGFGSMFGAALGGAIARTGIGATGSTAGNIAGQIATQTIVSATTVSANMRSKDEISLDVKLTDAGNSTLLSQVFKVKAKSNGDDIISKVVESAAQAIVNASKRG